MHSGMLVLTLGCRLSLLFSSKDAMQDPSDPWLLRLGVGKWIVDLSRKFIATVHSAQSTISQSSTLSRIVRRCWSIFQAAYSVRVDPAALRCAGPRPPSMASSRDRQMQVARFCNSESGLPNQYLSTVSVEVDKRTGFLLEESAAGNGFGVGGLVQLAKVAVFGTRLDLRTEGDDVEGGLFETLSRSLHSPLQLGDDL